MSLAKQARLLLRVILDYKSTNNSQPLCTSLWGGLKFLQVQLGSIIPSVALTVISNSAAYSTLLNLKVSFQAGLVPGHDKITRSGHRLY